MSDPDPGIDPRDAELRWLAGERSRLQGTVAQAEARLKHLAETQALQSPQRLAAKERLALMEADAARFRGERDAAEAALLGLRETADRLRSEKIALQVDADVLAREAREAAAVWPSGSKPFSGPWQATQPTE